VISCIIQKYQLATTTIQSLIIYSHCFCECFFIATTKRRSQNFTPSPNYVRFPNWSGTSLISFKYKQVVCLLATGFFLSHLRASIYKILLREVSTLFRTVSSCYPLFGVLENMKLKISKKSPMTISWKVSRKVSVAYKLLLGTHMEKHTILWCNRNRAFNSFRNFLVHLSCTSLLYVW
jgi:hypothetical protein